LRDKYQYEAALEKLVHNARGGKSKTARTTQANRTETTNKMKRLLTDAFRVTGLAGAILAHTAANAAKKLLNEIRKPESAKPDFSKLTGLEKAVAAHRHASKAK
jgi:hypothetical protein